MILILAIGLSALVFTHASPIAQQQEQQQLSRRWGFDMHRMGARISEDYMTSAAFAVVDDILDGESLEDASTWADSTGRDLYPWSSSLHYVNTDDNACVVNNVQLSKYCANDNCINGAIQNYTDRLQRNVGNMEENLKFLLHFVGDVHQPLHAGQASDLGGNTIDVRFYGSTWNLHSLWDTGIPARRESELGSEAALEREIRSKMTGEWSGLISGWQATAFDDLQMATESAQDCCDLVYDVEDGDTISDAYYNESIDMFEQAIARYAIRFATLMNEIFDSKK